MQEEIKKRNDPELLKVWTACQATIAFCMGMTNGQESQEMIDAQAPK